MQTLQLPLQLHESYLTLQLLKTSWRELVPRERFDQLPAFALPELWLPPAADDCPALPVLPAVDELPWPEVELVVEPFLPDVAVAPAPAAPASVPDVAVYFVPPSVIDEVTPPESALVVVDVPGEDDVPWETPIAPPAEYEPPKPDPAVLEFE
jgi:hypothetical protein